MATVFETISAQTEPPAAEARATITATMLGDIVRCEMRAHLDLNGAPDQRVPLSGFVEMLFAQGNRHEEAIIAGLPGEVVDLRSLPMAGRIEATLAAMDGEGDWILGARLVDGDMEGRPDLLHRHGGKWRAGDIKSGSATQPNGTDPRREYAAQVGLYGRLVEALGVGRGDRVFVIGSDGEQVWFDLDAPISRGGPLLRDFVDELVARARGFRDGTGAARPALSSLCGLCVWRDVCRATLFVDDDLTLVPGLGRSVRGAIETVAPTVAALADIELDGFATKAGRTILPGVGASRLATFRERARMLVGEAAPFAIAELGLSRRNVEFHVDLETDPTSDDFCYLHGIVRRRREGGVDVEEYVPFLAASRDEERNAFVAAVDFMAADPGALITTFSAFERSTYRRLVGRYPDVGAERVEALFAPGRCVDLYFDAVLPKTHWPLNSLGLKPIAKFLGFDWNDPDASGAASISWFVEWCGTRDPALLERILRYNEADCRASRVVFDALIALPVMAAVPWPVRQR